MFEFFIALFGGLFWGGKIHKEKTEAKRAQSDFEDAMAIRNARRSEFERKVIDRLNKKNAETMGCAAVEIA